MKSSRACFLTVSLCLVAASGSASADQTPAGVEQILPRGALPAIAQPRFVSADKAVLSDDAWILGVLLDGQARAYSLNLLDRHEVVNDQIGGRDFAAVW